MTQIDPAGIPNDLVHDQEPIWEDLAGVEIDYAALYADPEVAQTRASSIAAEPKTAPAAITPEFRFTAKVFARVIELSVATAMSLARMEQDAEFDDAIRAEHALRVAARRAGTERAPVRISRPRPATRKEITEDKALMYRALLHVLQTHHRAQFYSLAKQIADVSDQIRLWKAMLTTVDADGTKSENALAKAMYDEYRALFAVLRNHTIERDAKVTAAHMKGNVEFSFIHNMKKAIVDLIIAEADNLAPHPTIEFLSKHVKNGHGDEAMALYGDGDFVTGVRTGLVTSLTAQLLNVEPRVSFTSKLERLDESVYRDTNEVEILDADTQKILDRQLADLGFFPCSFVTNLETPGKHSAAILAAQINALETEIDRQQRALDFDLEAADEATLDELRESVSIATAALTAFTEPTLYGYTYKIGKVNRSSFPV